MQTPSPSDKRRKVTNSNVSIREGADLGSSLDCPVCLSQLLPPIFQCRSGHVICSDCAEKVNLCPSCRCAFSKNNRLRCLALESVIEQLAMPCSFSDCDEVIPYLHKPEHEKICNYRAIGCNELFRTSSCVWRESVTELKEHIIECQEITTRLIKNNSFTKFTVAYQIPRVNPKIWWMFTGEIENAEVDYVLYIAVTDQIFSAELLICNYPPVAINTTITLVCPTTKAEVSWTGTPRTIARWINEDDLNEKSPDREYTLSHGLFFTMEFCQGFCSFRDYTRATPYES